MNELNELEALGAELETPVPVPQAAMPTVPSSVFKMPAVPTSIIAPTNTAVQETEDEKQLRELSSMMSG